MLCLALIVSVAFAAPPQPESVPASGRLDSASWVLFASPDCDDCEWTREEFLPGLAELAGAHPPPVLYANVDTDAGYELLLAVEAAVGAGGQAWPVLLAADRLFYGREALQDGRDALVEVLTARTPQAKSLAALSAQADALIPLDEVDTAHAGGPAPAVPGGMVGVEHYRQADILYFETVGCKKCARVERQLSHLMPRFTRLTIARVNTQETRGRILQEAALTWLGARGAETVQTPMLASATTWLVGEALTDERIEGLLTSAQTASPPWRTWDETAEFARAERALRDLGGTFTVAAIVGAGLVDGINPCAFAVIVFLVSYLTLSRSLPRRQGLIYGLMFCLGVFVCYLLIGLGFSQLLGFFQRWQGVQRWIYLVTGVVCLLFVAGAAYDTWRAWRRGATHMAFVTPKRFTNVVHRMIRQNVGRGLLVAGAFAVGFVVSSLELVCTGQMYLPVIAFINSSSGGAKGRGIVLLLLYNTAFIIPLLIVLLVGVYGAGSKRLAEWGGRHVVAMRALTGLVILGLAILMFVLAARTPG